MATASTANSPWRGCWKHLGKEVFVRERRSVRPTGDFLLAGILQGYDPTVGSRRKAVWWWSPTVTSRIVSVKRSQRQIEGLEVLVIRPSTRRSVVRNDPVHRSPVLFDHAGHQHIFHTLGVEINEQVAQHLFFGLLPIQVSSVSSVPHRGETLRMAAELWTPGLSQRCLRRYDRGRDFDSIKYLARLIDRTEPMFDGKIMVSHETEEDVKEFDPQNVRAMPLYSALLSVKGVQAVVYFKLPAPGKVGDRLPRFPRQFRRCRRHRRGAGAEAIRKRLEQPWKVPYESIRAGDRRDQETAGVDFRSNTSLPISFIRHVMYIPGSCIEGFWHNPSCTFSINHKERYMKWTNSQKRS
jgi:hypothetical protein